MPAGEIAWTKSTEWFDVGVASTEFLAAAGDKIILISIEVARPEMRVIEATFQVKNHSPITFCVQTLCGGGRSYLPKMARELGDRAKSIGENYGKR